MFTLLGSVDELGFEEKFLTISELIFGVGATGSHPTQNFNVFQVCFLMGCGILGIKKQE